MENDYLNMTEEEWEDMNALLKKSNDFFTSDSVRNKQLYATFNTLNDEVVTLHRMIDEEKSRAENEKRELEKVKNEVESGQTVKNVLEMVKNAKNRS